MIRKHILLKFTLWKIFNKWTKKFHECFITNCALWSLLQMLWKTETLHSFIREIWFFLYTNTEKWGRVEDRFFLVFNEFMISFQIIQDSSNNKYFSHVLTKKEEYEVFSDISVQFSHLKDWLLRGPILPTYVRQLLKR